MCSRTGNVQHDRHDLSVEFVDVDLVDQPLAQRTAPLFIKSLTVWLPAPNETLRSAVAYMPRRPVGAASRDSTSTSSTKMVSGRSNPSREYRTDRMYSPVSATT